MADSVKFTIGGQLGASYRSALSQSVKEAEKANLQLQRTLKAQMAATQAELVAGTNMTRATALSDREERLQKISLAVQNAAYLKAAKERVAIKEAEVAAELAATKAAQLAEITMVARQGGIGAASGGHGHRYGGQGGVISEIAVIGHEILQGRGFGRILGSISILAGRLGWLGKMVKSTAAAEITAALAENALAASMARTAVAAEAKAAASVAAATAEGADAVATQALAAADTEAATAARANAVAQIAKAEAATEAAEMAAAAATVSLGPVGWLVAGVIVLGSVLAGLAFHMHTLAVRAKNLADLMDPLKKKFTEQAEAVRADAKEHAEFLDWLKKVGAETDSLPEKIDRVVKKMREQAQAEQELARARGASKMAIEAMEEAQLQAELMVVTRGKLQAQREAEQAGIAARAADAAFTTNPSENGVDLKSATRVAQNAGEIVDAVQAVMESGPTVTEDTGQYSVAGTPIQHNRPANEKDPMTVTVGSKSITISLAAAKAAYEKSMALEDRLTKVKEDLARAMTDTKTTYEEKTKAVRQLTDEAADIQQQLGIKQTIGRQLASSAHPEMEMSQWEKAGGSMGGITMMDIGREQLRELKGIRTDIRARRSAGTASGGESLADIFGS